MGDEAKTGHAMREIHPIIPAPGATALPIDGLPGRRLMV
jgi:hypothetical protein